jgi:hypothetical protein
MLVQFHGGSPVPSLPNPAPICLTVRLLQYTSLGARGVAVG